MDSIFNVKKENKRLKKYPMALYVHEEKPQFHLSDGDILYCYLLDLENRKILTKKYGGSGDSVSLHESAQLSAGLKSPNNLVMMFVEMFPTGGWIVTIVGNLIKLVDNTPASPVLTNSLNLDEIRKKLEQRLEESLRKDDEIFIEHDRIQIIFFRTVDYGVEKLMEFLDNIRLNEINSNLPYDDNKRWSLIFEINGNCSVTCRFFTEYVSNDLSFQPVSVKMEDIDYWIKRVKKIK